jgi:hypothetical protein
METNFIRRAIDTIDKSGYSKRQRGQGRSTGS